MGYDLNDKYDESALAPPALVVSVVYVVCWVQGGGAPVVDYLELARRAQKSQSNPDPVMDMRRTDPEAQRLLAAGWKPKERGGLVIWARLENGFYYSQEVALHCLK